MPWSDLENQSRAAGILRRAIQNGRISHAYLFAGPDGVGKMTAARLFAQAVNCLRSDSDPCGICVSCEKIARSMNPDESVHPDIVHLAPGRWIGPDGRKQASHTIGIDAVRDIRGNLYNAPLEAHRRVVIVHEADSMQIAAQNAFLKTLEEPMERLRTLFLLVSSRPDALLPTIRSRCQRIAFGAIPLARIKEHLLEEFELDERQADLVAALAEGSMDRARALADTGDPDEIFSERREWLDLWERFGAGESDGFPDLVRTGSGSRDKLAFVLSLMISFYRDVLLVSSGSGGVLSNPDREEQIRREAERLSPKSVAFLIETLLEIQDSQNVYTRADLAMQSLLVTYQEQLRSSSQTA